MLAKQRPRPSRALQWPQGLLRRAGRLTSLADRTSDGNPICSFEFSRDANGNPPVGGRFARMPFRTCRRPIGTPTYYSYNSRNLITRIDSTQEGFTPNTFGYPPVGGRFARDRCLREDGSCWYYDHDQDADAGFGRIGNPNVEARNPKQAPSPKSPMTETSAADATARDLTASRSAFPASCFEVVSDFEIRASDFCPATLRTSLVANGTPTYYTYNAANELLQEVTPGGETGYYSYDGRGNQTQRSVLGGETTYYSYNSRNLITRIDSTQEGFTPNTFGYNALGQRIRITDSTGTKWYVWDGLDILLEHDGTGTLLRRYTHGHTAIRGVGSLIAVQDAEGNFYFYHVDQVGGVHRLTDIAQAVAKLYEFGPFGRMLQETGSAPNEFVFPGTYILLADVQGAALSASRQYRASAARYTGRDAEAPTPTYAGLGANPMRCLDPSGRFGCTAERPASAPPRNVRFQVYVADETRRFSQRMMTALRGILQDCFDTCKCDKVTVKVSDAPKSGVKEGYDRTSPTVLLKVHQKGGYHAGIGQGTNWIANLYWSGVEFSVTHFGGHAQFVAPNGAAHEIGEALGLPHDKQGIMVAYVDRNPALVKKLCSYSKKSCDHLKEALCVR